MGQSIPTGKLLFPIISIDSFHDLSNRLQYKVTSSQANPSLVLKGKNSVRLTK